MNSEHIVCHIAAALDWELYQIDVKTAYLYGDLDEEIYMEQLKGFDVDGYYFSESQSSAGHLVFLRDHADA